MSLPILEIIPSDFSIAWDGVETSYYNQLGAYIDALGKRNDFTDNDQYQEAKYIVSNHLLLIHEYLNLGKVNKGFDYERIKEFAIKNKDLVRYLFKKEYPEFSSEVFDFWVQPSIDILECAMYLPSNRYNKHTYH